MMRRSPTPAHFYCPLSPFARLPYSPFYIIYRLRIAPRSELVTSARNASNRERVMRKTLLGAVSATAVFVSMPAVAQDAPPPAAQDPAPQAESKIGRASCREEVCQNV